MAKMKKLPKKPKASASLQTWENYHKRVKAVQAYNRKLVADKKKKEKLISKAQGLGKI